jgi:hypothetical protein
MEDGRVVINPDGCKSYKDLRSSDACQSDLTDWFAVAEALPPAPLKSGHLTMSYCSIGK